MASDPNNIYDQDDTFWSNYVKGRPQVSDSFLGKIFEYHKSHGGKFGTIHEAGAGIGVLTQRLLLRFSKVVLTDPFEQHIKVAESRLREHQSRIDFQAVKLEDSSSCIQPQSVDVVLAASMMHHTNVPAAVKAVHEQLKPGGTFAMSVQGLVVLSDQRVQDLWTKLLHKGIEKTLLTPEILADPAKRASMIERVATSASAYDAIALPESMFEPGVLRYRINFPNSWDYYDEHIPPSARNIIPKLSRAGPNDKVLYESLPGGDVKYDFAGFKEHVETFPLWSDRAAYEENWREIEGAFGDRTIEGVCLAVLVLATRKR